ncbi:hypothetical protein FGO68_gene4433 [Halteria grandinella]|uniref:Uncharacterized protein n=1 Tax=Halteria grandinella TaxID=5974 RepID=A0A8J8P4Z4_HALGN|nr:hypothetical protein FGO68_gene4433 [Halteria grandinella]
MVYQLVLSQENRLDLEFSRETQMVCVNLKGVCVNEPKEKGVQRQGATRQISSDVTSSRDTVFYHDFWSQESLHLTVLLEGPSLLRSGQEFYLVGIFNLVFILKPFKCFSILLIIQERWYAQFQKHSGLKGSHSCLFGTGVHLFIFNDLMEAIPLVELFSSV